MHIDKNTSDLLALQEIGQRLAALRIQNNLTQADLAQQAGVSKRTIERLEAGEVATQLSGFLRVCRVLGVLERFETLLPEPSPGPMAQLKQQGRQRQRASAKKVIERKAKKWTWVESS